MIDTIPIGSVQVEGEIGRRIDNTIQNNMLAVDIENDFLKPFRGRDAESLYIGIGHFLDALTRFEKYRPDGDVGALKDRTITALSETRESNGYIGLFPKERRLSRLWDIHETSHLIYGLSSDHRYWKEERSIDLARGLASNLIEQWRAHPELVANQVVMSTLDLEPALMNLYAESGDENYLDFCISDRTLEDWDRPIIEGRWGRIEGHIYDYLSRCIAQLTLMRWQPAFGLTRTASRAIDYMVSGDGMMITGELGDHECWHASQEGTIHLGETCATAYLIRLLHHLLRQTRDPFYGDLMERAIYNALFAAQSPDGRRIRYYTPIEGPREYFGPDTYCCPNNFRRIASELPEMLWYQTSDGFLLNLFSDSVVKSKSPDGTVVQLNTRTVYPSEGRIEVEVVPDRPCQFSIDVRIPRWCRAPIVRTNGSSADRSVDSGSLHRIARVWTPGDTIELELPMPIRMIAGRKAQSGRAAFMRGPSVFCLSTNRQKDLDNNVVKLLIFDPSSATESTMENSIRPGGGQIEIDAWSKDSWYPSEAPDLSLTLSEFPDPEGELVYLKTPVPNDRRAGSDELLGAGRRRISSGVGDYYSDTIAEEYSDEANAKTLRRLQS